MKKKSLHVTREIIRIIGIMKFCFFYDKRRKSKFYHISCLSQTEEFEIDISEIFHRKINLLREIK